MTLAQRSTTDGPGGHREARVASRREGDFLVVDFAGAWTTRNLDAQEAALAALSPAGAGRVRLDLSAVSDLDTAGAWLVHRTTRDLKAMGLAVELAGARDTHLGLIRTVGQHDAPCPPPPRPENPVVAVVLHAGKATFTICAAARDLVGFLGHTVVALLRALVQPRRIRVKAVVNHMEKAGLDAMPIVGLISFLIGVVLAYQGADQLARFGAQIFTVNLVGIGVLREMGIILTAIMVAGRSGSAFTAQIGTMQVNEEIDAMRTIGLDPMDVLVIPRVLALVLVMPLLTFYANIMGLLGGAVMAMLALDISFVQFIRQLNDAVPIWSFWVGIIKAPIFAFIIGMVGCYEGFKVTRSAESVGLRTTTSVVESIFLVIVLDAMFSILFSYIGI